MSDDKKEENKQDKKKEDFRWQKPSPNQKKQTVDSKEFYWCPHHQNKMMKEWGQRVQHKPEECNNKYTGKQESPSTTMLQPNSNLQPCSNRMQI